MNTLSIQEFPKNIKEEIFSFFSMNELSKACQVCKEWNEISLQDRVWKKVAKDVLKNDIPVPTNNVKKRLQAICVASNDEIIERIESFVKQVTPGINAQFQCFIREKDSKPAPITLTILTNNDRNTIDEAEGDITENVIAINGIGNASLKEVSSYKRNNKVQTMAFLSGKKDKAIYRLTVDRRLKGEIVVPHLPHLPYYTTLPLNQEIEKIAIKKITSLEPNLSYAYALVLPNGEVLVRRLGPQ